MLRFAVVVYIWNLFVWCECCVVDFDLWVVVWVGSFAVGWLWVYIGALVVGC